MHVLAGRCDQRRRQRVRGGNCAAGIIDDLALGPRIPAQAARPFQSPAHLVDHLARADAESARELVVIQRTAGTSKLIQNACGDGRAGHGQMIPHDVLV
jgi:hypothetical protein